MVEIATGKEVASADWRMHDHDRYLWPLGKGLFLVRQANVVFRTNASLQLVPYGRFPGNTVLIQISPEGSLLVAQTREPEEGAQAAPVDSLTSEFLQSTSKPIMVRIVRVSDGQLIGKSRARAPVNLPLNADGFAEVLEGKPDNWVISFAPMTSASNPEKPKPLAELSSTCRPTVSFLNHETMMAVRCTKSRDHSVLALDLKGNKLWEHEVENNHIWADDCALRRWKSLCPGNVKGRELFQRFECAGDERYSRAIRRRVRHRKREAADVRSCDSRV